MGSGGLRQPGAWPGRGPGGASVSKKDMGLLRDVSPTSLAGRPGKAPWSFVSGRCKAEGSAEGLFPGTWKHLGRRWAVFSQGDDGSINNFCSQALTNSKIAQNSHHRILKGSCSFWSKCIQDVFWSQIPRGVNPVLMPFILLHFVLILLFYSGTPLHIHSRCNSLHLPTHNSHSPSPLHPPGSVIVPFFLLDAPWCQPGWGCQEESSGAPSTWEPEPYASSTENCGPGVE